MDDTVTLIIAIVVTLVLMFMFPLMTMADKTDDMAQMSAETSTTDFVDHIRTTGKITPEEYNKFLQELNSTGNTYNVDFTIKIRDQNLGKKAVQVNSEKIGEDVYYNEYTSQVMDVLDNNNVYYLKEGDFVYVYIKNNNQTIAVQLRNFFYSVTGQNAYTISFDYGGMVQVNGN